MKHILRSLAFAAGVVVVFAATVRAQVVPRISVQGADLAAEDLVPFTFDVPVRIEGLHRDVRQLAIHCLVSNRVRQTVATGTVILQANVVASASGAVSQDVVVAASLEPGQEPSTANTYLCRLYLTDTDAVFSDSWRLPQHIDRKGEFQPWWAVDQRNYGRFVGLIVTGEVPRDY